MSRILIIADTHLRPSDFEVKSRLLKRYLHELDYDMCFIVGDLFDQPKIGNKKCTANYMIETINKIFQCGKPVIILEGNHDQAPDYSALQLLKGPIICNQPLVMEFTDYVGLIVPWMRNDSDYKNSVIEHLESFNEVVGGNKPRYLFGHINLAGANMSGNITVNPQSYFCFEEADFKNLDITAGFLGHLHERQTKGKFTYIGAMAQLNFGEEGNPPGVMIYNTSTNEAQYFAWPETPGYVTIDEFDSVEKVTNFTNYGHHVRVYTDDVDQYNDMPLVKAIKKKSISDAHKQAIDFYQEKEVNIFTLASNYYNLSSKVPPESDLFYGELAKMEITLQKPTTGLTMVHEVKLQGTKLGKPAEVYFGPGLNCVMGKNGSGKTAVVESIHASLFHSYIDRGHVKNFIVEDKGYVSAKLSYEDQVMNISHVKNGNKNELYILEKDQPKQSFSLVKLFDDKVQKVFGDEALFLGLVFGDQNNKFDLISCSDSERLFFLRKVFNLGCFDDLNKHYKSELITVVEQITAKNNIDKSIQELLDISNQLVCPSNQAVQEVANKISSLELMIKFNEENLAALKDQNELAKLELELETFEQNTALVNWDLIKEAVMLKGQLKVIDVGCSSYDNIGCKENPILSCSLLKAFNPEKRKQVQKELDELKPKIPIDFELLYRMKTFDMPALKQKIQNLESKLKDFVIDYAALTPHELHLAKENLASLKQTYDAYYKALNTKTSIVQKMSDLQEKYDKIPLDIDQRFDAYTALSELTGKHGIPMLILSSIANKLQNIIQDLVDNSDLKIKISIEADHTEFKILFGPDKLPVKLCSGGQKALIRILFKLGIMIYLNQYYGNYKVLIMDEPTAAIDYETTIDIAVLFKTASKHFNQIIVVTHCSDFAQVADHVIWIT